jgi:hypothetical protein
LLLSRRCVTAPLIGRRREQSTSGFFLRGASAVGSPCDESLEGARVEAPASPPRWCFRCHAVGIWLVAALPACDGPRTTSGTFLLAPLGTNANNLFLQRRAALHLDVTLDQHQFGLGGCIDPEAPDPGVGERRLGTLFLSTIVRPARANRGVRPRRATIGTSVAIGNGMSTAAGCRTSDRCGAMSQLPRSLRHD